jgi:hypothetical protein
MDNNLYPEQVPGAFFKVTVIIHAALIAGQLLFAAMAFFITPSAGLNLKPGNDIFFYAVPAVVIFGMLAGTFYYRQLLAKISPEATLKEKTAGYQTAFIARCGIAEGASLFTIIIFMANGNLFYLIVLAINVLYFVWIRPTKQKIEDDMDLTYEDKTVLSW